MILTQGPMTNDGDDKETNQIPIFVLSASEIIICNYFVNLYLYHLLFKEKAFKGFWYEGLEILTEIQGRFNLTLWPMFRCSR